jgi:predicted transcriptional regulator
LYLLSLIAENINAVVVSDKQGKVEWANASLP